MRPGIHSGVSSAPGPRESVVGVRLQNGSQYAHWFGTNARAGEHSRRSVTRSSEQSTCIGTTCVTSTPRDWSSEECRSRKFAISSAVSRSRRRSATTTRKLENLQAACTQARERRVVRSDGQTRLRYDSTPSALNGGCSRMLTSSAARFDKRGTATQLPRNPRPAPRPGAGSVCGRSMRLAGTRAE